MSEDQFLENKQQTNLVAQIVHRYVPFWPLLAVLLAITMSVAYVYLRAQTKLYVATAKVLLKDSQKNSGDSKVLEALNIYGDKKVVENEILVLKSNSLMQTVVKKLDLYTTIYNKGKVQTEELYGSNSPLIFQAINEDSTINGGGQFSLVINWEKNTYALNNVEHRFSDVLSLNGTDYRIIVNNSYNKTVKGKDYFVIFNSAAGAAGGIGVNANAQSYASSVIDLSITTPVPEKAIAVLNKLFEVYNVAGVKDKNEMGVRTLKFVDERLAKVTADLDSIERGEANLRATEGITDIAEQSGSYSGALKTLDQAKIENELKAYELEALEGYIYSKGRKPGIVPAGKTVKDQILSGLLSDLYNSEFELEKNRTTANEKSETVSLLVNKIARIKTDIKENIGNIKDAMQLERNSVNSQIGKYTGLIASLPAKERRLIAIQRQQVIKNNIYTFLLNKREETAISSASTAPDLRVLENASAGGPISPIPKNYYTTGFVIGLIAFLLFVQLNEPLSSKILFRTEIEKKTSVPVVGEIIQAKEKNTIAISEGKRTVIAEQFRSLRTNLGFMGLSETNKVLLVTSSVSGEGKSFIATNLAMSITLTGKKVALLELDLRKPKLSKQLGIKRDPGISNYLIGKCALEEIIKPTEHKNLFLITAGPIPPNPTELIELPTFAVMIAELKKQFDYLIIDSAPIGPVTDSQLLNSYVQTTIYVVRHNVTPSLFLNLMDNLNKEKKFPNMCAVFNGVKPRGISFFNYGFGGYGNGYGYGFGYGYGYGYGYGSEAAGYYNADGEIPGYKNLFGFLGFIKKIFKRK